MYFRIIRNGHTLAVGDDILDFSATFEISATGTFTVEYPIKYARYLMYKNSVVIYFENGLQLEGISTSKRTDVAGKTITVNYSEALYEWTWESVPINVVKKNADIYQLMEDPDIIYTKNDWSITVDGHYTIEYEFSRETKREVLDKLINLTPDLNYRTSLTNPRHLEVGKFGEHREYLVTFDNIVDNLIIEDDSSAIMNVIVALSDKSDGGATSITLRDVYDNPHLQKEGFPVIITGNKINTQAPQVGYNYTEYAPNNINEYAVVDEESIRREDGDIYEGTSSDNSVQPVQEDGESISNEDRISASLTLYNQVVRKCIYSRRNLRFTKSVTDFPIGSINVGDKVRSKYGIDFSELCACFGLYTATQMTQDDWLYLIRIDISLQADGSFIYELTLSLDLAEYFSVREY